MFKLVESLSTAPVRFPIKPGVSLAPGHVVSIVDYEGDLVVDLCDGNAPFGLLGNRCFGGGFLDFGRKANVYPQRMVVDLNRFDRDHEIQIGSPLYCNTKGLLSSQQPSEHAFVLANVITPASEEKSHMQILWL
ncbi:hypothetical protein M0R72_02190 [Candidatus Pacearchaeota archaeon]|jgi:hypothetical protein|nr:hypothetical protein [Candidatus Pacearchaeota archaeon]